MPRQKNIKPTSIYWLYDMRPEMTATGWSDGKPFYCGKTVKKPEHRLSQHRCKRTSKVGIRMQECGNFVRIKIMGIVPIEQDWIERERFWIRTLRALCPDCLNVSDGGEGPAGVVFSAAQRARMSAAHVGKRNSPESIARGAEKRRGRHTPERIAKRAATRLGKKASPETCAKLRTSHIGKTASPETRAKMSAAQIGRKTSPEHRAKLVKAWERNREARLQTQVSRLGMKHSPESRAKMRAAALRRNASVPSYVPTSPTS